MNFSPLNDPEFQKYRKEAHEKAATARRKRTLIILFVVAALSLISVGLLTAAALEVAPRVIEQYNPPENTLPELPPITETETATEPVEINTALPPGMRATTIYIDAGHGFLSPSGTAIDSGAGEGTFYTKMSEELTGSALYEADLNLIIAQKVKDLLHARGYTIIMSREGYVNQALSINARASRVNQTDADALVSIHANSTSDTSVSGTRVYYCNRADFGRASEGLANAVADAINQAGASHGREAGVIQNKTYVMINSTTLPSILVETCFLTNEEDAAAALTEEWQNAMAGAIASAVMEQFPLEYTNV